MRWSRPRPRPGPPRLLLAVLTLAVVALGEHVRDLEVSEGAPVGTRVGLIGDGEGGGTPPYLIVPVPGSPVDSDLAIDQSTGEIRTRVRLDRETRASYSLVAIPTSGENVRVVVRVRDENDNAPTFPTPVMNIEFPENTPRDVKRTLQPARDPDLGAFSTQRYSIVSGNVNNAFKLSSHEERDGVLYLDLQIHGILDRETTAFYSLLIEAVDGGSPPLRGTMTVNITILDVNDNQPLFNQSRYFATIPENATVGTGVLQVFATDADAGDNGQVEYSINRRQSDRAAMFKIDPATGQISVNRPLDFETKQVHELVVVAKDHGLQPLETTAFVSISVTDVNDNQPTINLIFLSDDATPKISEAAQPGEFVARISVHDPDSKSEYSPGEHVNVTLEGGDGCFGLANRDNIIYLVIVSLPLDREARPNYTLSVVATDGGSPPLHASRTFHLRVTDVNDNPPEFTQSQYTASVMEVAEPGTSVARVRATDRDEGVNAEVTYSLVDTPESHSGWFQVDAGTGVVSLRAHVDCETDPQPRLVVVASDRGQPPLSATATVLVTVHDVNDNEPIFDQSFYNVTVAENEAPGCSILKVSATDPDCGVNAMVNYTLGEDFGKMKEFSVRPSTGEICIAGDLDYETRNVFEFAVLATDRGGLSTTAMVKIQLTDVNDNAPVFLPREYNVSLRPNTPPNTPVVVVVATDRDSGRYAEVTYAIAAGNEAGAFRIDAKSGELFVSRADLLQAATHRLNVSATDGGGLRSPVDAQVSLTVVASDQRPPLFERPRYTYSVRENVPRLSAVGAVRAASGDAGGVRYSLYPGDPDGYFSIDPVSGGIRTAAALDHETHQSVLLNVQATSGDPPAYGHTQVNINIEDVNDNAPEFDSATVRLSVPENAGVGVALYAALARDRDSGRNGEVSYRLGPVSDGPGASSGSSSAGRPLFVVHPRTGHLTLTRPLDYEAAQRHTLVLTATDAGEPPLSSNLTVLVEVQDVNDNPPVFERPSYAVSMPEGQPVNAQVVQVTAVDLDTGNNARLTYRLQLDDDEYPDSLPLSVAPTTGWLSLRAPLDREVRDRYQVAVVARDSGTPPLSATTTVTLTVLDDNDNDPAFGRDRYDFAVEENAARGTVLGVVTATDRDLGPNAAIRYALLGVVNNSFTINPVTGEVTTRGPLDREARGEYELVAEAKDGGSPARSARVPVRVTVLDVNDNAPELVDPQDDVLSVREEQPPGTEVGHLRAVDRDLGANASVTFSIVRDRDSESAGLFTVDPVTGVIRTRAVLNHEDRAIYRLQVAATDAGTPPRQTVRVLRIEVLDVNDNRSTFTSSSLVFQVREDAPIGYQIGTVAGGGSLSALGDVDTSPRHVTYTLTSLSPAVEAAADQDGGMSPASLEVARGSGALVVAGRLDRERVAEYRLEVRAQDTGLGTASHPQSAAVSVRVEVLDVNDNAPAWPADPVNLSVREDAALGTALWNLTAADPDQGVNGELRYSLLRTWPALGAPFDTPPFAVDPLTGTVSLAAPLDHETIHEYTLVLRATDQAANASERLSATMTARVRVEDANDNAPEFVSPATVSVRYAERAGAVLSHVVAVDRDRGDNGRVTYVIAAGNEDGRLALGYDTGLLSLARPLPRPLGPGETASLTLNVTASDHGKPLAKHASVRLTVVLRGATDAPPRFTRPLYAANISEDAHPGSFVARVSARPAGTAAAAGADSSTSAGNLTYHIPAGAADDRFAVDPVRGVVTTRAPLDRELRDHYKVPILAVDSAAPDLYDEAVLEVTLTDVNDHAPSFPPGSCYTVRVPENAEEAVIHSLAAEDADLGANGEVTYTITAGNVGNKLRLDPNTGELTAKSLDRESVSQYWLVVTARDRGSPKALQGSCNISVVVLDQNDNDPQFAQPRYAAQVAEGVPVGHVVVTVRGRDADAGENARLTYTLANETHWLFAIDNETGVITTAGPLDRERQSEYRLEVVATDGGRYSARSQSVPVHITVTDVNDEAPVFSRFPFTASVAATAQPGQSVIRVSAQDADQGVNGEVLYSLEHGHHDRFRLDPSTGVVSVASALTAEAGRLFRLTVLARDKGNPPLSSTGMVEVRVTGASSLSDEEAASLRFQNASYAVQLEEHAAAGTAVAQVQAVRSDGRLQRISYRLLGPGGAAGAGPQDAFDIHPTTGLVRVRDPARLDYERAPTVSLVVRAEAEGATAAMPGLTGYTELVVRLSDVNDNEPRFTQRVYQAAVWEGRSKGTAVLRVAAVDADQGGDSQGVTGGLLYHIVDGNHDNAFVISPATSGLVKTNIVLDREIRDSYRLTVIATDQGQGSSGRQLTGTATIRISVVDVNDNRPTFPPHSVVSVSEARALGTPITAVTANDVDTYPALTYSFASAAPSDPNDPPALSQSEGPFAIDRFSGTVTLTRHLDYEARREHQLRVVASDSAYTAVTELTVKVQDDNDNAPVFTRDEYEARLTGAAEAGQALLTVNATDADSGLNGEVRYALRRRDGQPSAAFYVDELTGALYANRSEDAAGLPRADADDVELVVVATDRGEPPLSATASVRVRVGDAGGITPKFTQDEYRVHIREDAPLGSTVVKIGVFSAFTADSGRDVEYAIVDGNLADTFRVLSPSGDVVVVRPLDREAVDLYSLRLAAGGRPGNASASSPSSSSILVHVTVDDANDHAPAFATPSYEAAVSEGAAVGTAVLTVAAVDADQAGGPNADVAYDILSGNDADLFAMDAASGVLSVKRPLDFDSGPTRFALVVRAADSARFPPDAPLASLAAVTVTLLDENDNAPQFPVSEYLELVPENEPAGTAVFTARAVDLDRGPFGALNYTIVSSGDADDSWRLFRVDAGSGLVTTNGVYDYEARNRYAFTLRATDAGGRSAHVRVRVEVESRDEFHPQFTERTYRLALPPGLGRGPLPAGTVLGSVTATDRDKGLDGRVVYQLNTQHPHLKVNRTTGAIVVKKKLDVAELYAGQDVSLVVTASSGRPGSLTNMTVVELSVDAAHAHGATEHNLASSALDAGMAGGAAAAGLADWALGLLIALILVVLAFGAVFLFLHVRNRRHKKVNKPGLGAHAHPHAGLGQLPHPGQHLGQHPHGLGHGMAGCGASTVASDTYVDPSAFDTIPMPRPPCHTSASLTGPFAPPKYDEIPPYRSSKAAKAAAAAKGGSPSSPGRGPTSELSGSEQSGSSGRGSAEDGEEEDEEIRMINEQRGHRRAEDAISDVSVHNTQQYLARLGIVDTNNHPASVSASASLHASTQASTRTSCSEPLDAMGHGLGLGHGALDETDVAAEADITNLIYAKLNDVGSEMSERGSERGSSVAGVAVGGTHVQPSMTGSLSSIVHSEEELTGSYNWDYLLDWGPQYQPLAHVFSEIARLKDDTDTDCASVQSGQSHKGSGSQKSGMLPVPMPPMPPMPQGPHPVPGPRTAPGPGGKTMQLPLPPLPPPLLTAVAPRTIPPIAPMSARGPPPSMAQLLLMPRSPISHDVAMTGGFSTSTAMSPSFSPSLSPLATRSPSLSPLSPPSHHVVSLPRTVTDTELRI